MKKIMLIISVITIFSACKKDFSAWKSYNEEMLQEFKVNLGKTLPVDTFWVSESGLLVEVYHRGQTSKMPKLNSEVECRFYKRCLVDGTPFYGKDYPVNEAFFVATQRKGLQEILCQMPEASYFKIYVPYELGYGKDGVKYNNFTIPPYSTLIYEIEIVNVEQYPPM